MDNTKCISLSVYLNVWKFNVMKMYFVLHNWKCSLNLHQQTSKRTTKKKSKLISKLTLKQSFEKQLKVFHFQWEILNVKSQVKYPSE